MLTIDPHRCDRCQEPARPAVRLVQCAYGCGHWQCEDHAAATEQERQEEEAHDIWPEPTC